MLTLNDGRSELWQWDTGRTLAVDADCSQVHFSNKVFGRSIDVDVVDGTAIIPDVLLQTDKDLNVWAFVGTAENGYTKISKTFKVNRRNKPADYVFTPPDQTSIEEIKEKIDYLESIQDPDAIKNAVADYISKNPITVEETDPTVPAWAKEAQKPSYTASEVGADPSGTAASKVAEHNTGADTHGDIRLLIQGLTDRLNALADSDDTTLDQLSEIVAYIKSNKSLIDSITTNKVNVADIVNDLVTNVSNKPLSAAQGVALKALIDAITVPDKLPNPNALTFTGAVTGSYDGSTAVSVEIPSGGSGGTDISLGLTSAAVGQIIKVKAIDESGKPTEWEAVYMPSGGGSDGGLSADEKTLLLTLLKNAKYAENVQPAYEQLEALFNGGAIVTYTVTNNLTDLTTDNEAATIAAGFPYKATLADAAGNKPKSVEVVMGGVDVSGEYYADGVIDIPSVGGELVITAFAKNTYPVIYKLANTPVTCNADLYEDTGLAFGSGSADGYTKSWTMVARVKNASAGYLWCVNGQKPLSSYYENKWNSDAGDKVMTINTYICNTAVSSGITQANPGEVCIVITKEALSEKTATVHYLSWAGAYVADTVTGTYGQFFNSVYAANMMVGGQAGADFVGTIEEFVIYDGIMQEYEIKAVLGV